MKPFRILFIVMILCLIVMISCSDNDKNPTEPTTVTGIQVVPNNANMPMGTQNRQFRADVKGTGNPPQEVDWSLEDKLAESTMISPTGRLTIAFGEIAPGDTIKTLTVIATSKQYPNIVGSATINVTKPVVTGMRIDPLRTPVNRGTSKQFEVEVTGRNSPPQTVTWKLSGHTNTTATKIDTLGVLSVANDEPVGGTLTITATSTYDALKIATATVTVTVPTVDSLSVTPKTVTVPRGTTQLLTATVFGTNDPPQKVIWSVFGQTNSQTAIDSLGVLKISIVEPAETILTVTATSFYESSKTKTAEVTVTAIGSVGLSGGYIFYDKGDNAGGWRYLEVAPVSSERSTTWGLQGVECPETDTGIGSGKANTEVIIAKLNANGETAIATQLSQALNSGGWFLPSKDELQEMFEKLQDGNIAGFIPNGDWTSGIYWSSSVYYGTSTDTSADKEWYSKNSTWSARFLDADPYIYQTYGGSRTEQRRIRAIRQVAE